MLLSKKCSPNGTIEIFEIAKDLLNVEEEIDFVEENIVEVKESVVEVKESVNFFSIVGKVTIGVTVLFIILASIIAFFTLRGYYSTFQRVRLVGTYMKKLKRWMDKWRAGTGTDTADEKELQDLGQKLGFDI